MLTKQNNQNKQNLLPVTALLGGAIIWGLLWYPYRVLEQAEISGSIATAITYFIALLLGLVSFRKDLRMSHIAGGEPYLLLGIALFAGWTNLAYVLGVIHGEVMRVLLLFYLAPLWTIVFSRLLLKEKLSLHGYLVIIVSLAGAITMLWEPESGSLLPSSYGDWMGLSAGFMFALLNVLSRKDQYHNVQSKSVAVWMGVTLTGFIYSLFLPDLSVLSSISMDSYLLLFGLGIIVFVLSVVVQYGVTHVPANRAIIIMLFELVVAAVAAYFLTDEAMTLKSWMGGALIVSASLFSARMNRE
ncbi:EamA domain-containing membrane protein RarD [Nitrosospira sp. Nsp5]|uniref:EamA domain-containing membrane protein RarD n=1 Tax=Nitrosospira multiformis TaxID=1231 RepID=A0ABY0TH76_9PROT|nr:MULTISPECIES: DMT family transporter [Nitrosospira]PTR05847.1 EamA domain-containing membrane protein RarD [Nitrosospira sp. Nsp5]SDQ60812.1 EamA domain-containing membrane protein RarD [Nitrosospira multiformis]